MKASLETAEKLQQQAFSLWEQGFKASPPKAINLLFSALRTFRQLSKIWTRETDPDKWVEIQHHSALILQELSDRHKGPERIALLKQSVGTARRPMLVLKRKISPRSWASAQFRLAQHLDAYASSLNSRERATFQDQAVKVCHRALGEISAETDPEFRAVIWMTLITIRSKKLRGNHGAGAVLELQHSVGDCRVTLALLDHRKHPMVWSSAQCLLGETLEKIGTLQKDLQRMTSWTEAREHYRLALSVFPLPDFPGMDQGVLWHLDRIDQKIASAS